MTLQVIDPHHRLGERDGQGAGIAVPDEKRRGETGPRGCRNAVDGGKPQPRLAHHARNEKRQIAQVLPGGHLRHDTAVGPVQLDLGTDRLRDDIGRAGIALHQRDGCLVAGGFDTEDAHPGSVVKFDALESGSLARSSTNDD
jgi:hypothetical protein